MREIYSKELDIELKAYNDLKKLPMHFVEDPMTITGMGNLITKYSNRYKDRTKIVFIDHSLLIKRLAGDTERQMLIDLANLANTLKKQHNIIFIILSQLNDAMTSPQRVNNRSLHYPNMLDLFGGRALGHISENVHIIVNPSKLNLPDTKYGSHKLPFTYDFKNRTYPMLYVHSIKCRDGKERITPLLNMLQYQNMIEFKGKHLQDFNKMYKLN
jgi:hypothetical protein